MNKYCSLCNINIDISCKKLLCKTCHNIKNRISYKEKQEKMLKDIEENGKENIFIKCNCCKKILSLVKFTKTFRKCKECYKEENKIRWTKIKEKISSEEYNYDFERICVICKENKKGTEYWKHKKSCIDCCKKTNKKYYNNSSDKLKKQTKIYREKLKTNTELINIPDKKICSSCKKEKNNNEFGLTKLTKCGLNSQCKLCRANKAKKYRKINYFKIKERESDHRKISNKLRNRIYKLLHSKSIKKQNNTLKLIDVDIKLFKKWLDFNLTIDELTINDCDIDHVIPCKFFDLIDLESQKNCFNWTNMTTLRKDLNNSKKDKILLTQVEEHKKRLITFCNLHNINIEKEMHNWNNTYKILLNNNLK